MNKIKILLVLLLAMVVLTGCAVFRKQQVMSLQRLELVKGQWVYLPTPAQLNFNHQSSGILNATYNKKSFTAEVHVEASKHRLVIVALGGWGGEIFSINYDGKHIKTSSLPMPNKSMGVLHTLADFILTHARPKLIRSMLKSTNISLLVKNNERIFMQNGKPIIIIHYENKNTWRGRITIDNLAMHYHIVVTTLESKHD
jgi:hypothetical protein